MSDGADAADLEGARAAAEAAVRLATGERAEGLEPVEGGLTNLVFSAEAGGAPLVVRLGPPEKRPVFEREARVIARVRREGVPAPEVMGTGGEEGFAFMVSRRLPGTMATHHPERVQTLKALGALAAGRIHRIRTSGFGRDFAFEEDLHAGAATGAEAWRRWLLDEAEARQNLGLLREHRVITPRREEELLRALDAVGERPGEPTLNHGDLRLKNVVVDEEGAIMGLIDWEESLSAAGPDWDLSVALHDLWADQMQAFLEGYGLDEAAILKAVPTWRLYNALNYGPEVRRALEEGDERALSWIRTRFSGALDLFGGA